MLWCWRSTYDRCGDAVVSSSILLIDHRSTIMLGRAVLSARTAPLSTMPSIVPRCTSMTPLTSIASLPTTSLPSLVCGVRDFKVRIKAPRMAPKRNRLPTPRQIRAAAARMEGVPATPIDVKVVADPALTPIITHPVVDLAQNEIGRVRNPHATATDDTTYQ
jgi:hypothetical protein